MPATVTADGVVYDSVGVRLKGNASYTHPNDKKPFRLSFDEYIGTQRWDGLKGIHLNNCWEDPTFMREKLHLDFARAAGIPAPRGSFAELYLNGELWGFYSMVEHVDKTFLTSRFGDNGGNLYKAVDGLLGGPISDFKWYGSNPAAYYTHYEFKTDDSLDPWTDLVAVIDSLNNSAGCRDVPASGREPEQRLQGDRDGPHDVESRLVRRERAELLRLLQSGNREDGVGALGRRHEHGILLGRGAELRDAQPHLCEQRDEPPAASRRSSTTRP